MRRMKGPVVRERPARWRGFVCRVAVLLCMVTTACRSRPEPSRPTSIPTPTATATATSIPRPTATRSPSPTGSPSGFLRNVIAWILDLGPSAPAGPTAFEIYKPLQERRCDAVVGVQGFSRLDQDVQRLYRGAASACLAAFQNGDRQHLWAEAENAYASMNPSALNCIDTAAYALLKRLVVAHRTNPHGDFEAVTNPGSAERPPCPTISGLDPARGPQNTTVTIRGSNLGRVEDVLIHYDDGSTESATLTRRDESTLVFKVPGETALGGTRTGCIALHASPRIEGHRKWAAAGKQFTLQGPASPPTGPPLGFSCPPNPT